MKVQESKVSEDQLVASTPWLNSAGLPKPDAELRSISREWDAATWELYLDSVVGKATPSMREALLPARAFDELLEETSETIWAYDEKSSNSSNPTMLIRKLCREFLSPDQKRIIRLIFWEGLTGSQVGKKLGVSRSTVMTQKRRAISKLKGLLEKMSSDFSISERSDFSNVLERSRDEEIFEVYQQDLQGSYLK